MTIHDELASARDLIEWAAGFIRLRLAPQSSLYEASSSRVDLDWS